MLKTNWSFLENLSVKNPKTIPDIATNQVLIVIIAPISSAWKGSLGQSNMDRKGIFTVITEKFIAIKAVVNNNGQVEEIPDEDVSLE